MKYISSKVESVLFFRRGALVRRKGQMELEKGKQTIRIEGVSSTANLDSVKIYSEKGVTCRNLRMIHLKEIEKTETKRVQDEIVKKTKEIEILEQQKHLWQTNGDFTKKESMNLQDVISYIETYPKKIQELDEKQDSIQKEILVLNEELEKISNAENRPLVEVDVEVQEDGLVSFELQYQESSARWNPFYEIHGDGEGPIRFKLRGEMTQDTQEDWENVSVVLSTGNPEAQETLPERVSLYLDIKEERPVAFAKNMALGMAKAMAPGDGYAMMEEAVMMDPVEVQEDETMTQYVLEERKDIHPTNQKTYVDLEEHLIPATYQVVVLPRFSSKAFLIATMQTKDMPIQNEISAALYYKDIYSGNVWLSLDYTKETIEISLGNEQRIHLVHKELGRKTTTTLLKGKKVLTYTYETTLSNHGEKEIAVLVRDQIPLSENKEIEIEPLELSGMKLEKETGFLEKEINLKNDKVEKLIVSYKVTSPNGKQIREEYRNKSGICPSCGSETYGQKFCPECGSPVNR